MRGLFRCLVRKKELRKSKSSIEEQMVRQVDALYNLLAGIHGSDRLVLKATKLEALDLVNAGDLRRRVLGLQRLVSGDPTLERLPKFSEINEILNHLEDQIADLLVRRSVEDKIEKKINERMQQRYEEYIREIKLQITKEEAGVENAQTLKKLAVLEKLNRVKLTASTIDILRPKKLDEIVGQERALRALISKLATPYPQHILLYGPPGVGKTSSARLALEEVKSRRGSVFSKDAPFVEVDGSTLRWDPRESTNPLLGSVHDPIYQGARRDLAETGIPEPKLGLVTEAHGGVLFIDEIGEMDPLLHLKLLKVLEDKRVMFESSYYDPSDSNIPLYIKKLFEEGAPADFVLIGATTRDAFEISPALRSRCAEIYFEPLTPAHIQEIVRNAAVKLGVVLEEGIPELISEYTVEGRKATNLLADAYAIAMFEADSADREESDGRPLFISRRHLYEVLQTSRLTPYSTFKAAPVQEVGKVLGLGVNSFLGSVIEIEAVAFPARERGKGYLRFNDAAGSMAKDSVFNATSVLRRLTGEEVTNYDLHINFIGGGRIDGPSAGLAITLAILSSIKGWGARQDVAVTGEISIQGRIKPVGGLNEKIYGARRAGVQTVIIPRGNLPDVPSDITGIQVVPVLTVEETLPILFSQYRPVEMIV